MATALLVGAALGLVLGLLGGGGGILAVPAFIHLLGMPVDQASTASLVVVAIGAMAGLIPHGLAGRVAWRTGAIFGLLGAGGAVLGARLALLADDRLQLAGLIALIFLAASGMLRDADDSSMTRMRHRIPADAAAERAVRVLSDGSRSAGIAGAGSPSHEAPEPLAPPTSTHPAARQPVRWLSPRLLGSATGVGLVTGFFGVGGGFVAVPALMWGARLPVRTATATGLLVIVINSLISLAARGPGSLPMPLTAEVALAAAVAAAAGAVWSRHVPARTLKRAFGWLLIVVGAHEVWQLAQLY
jgi:hypothetical protein